MRFMRKAAFAAVLSCAIIWSSCGDTYRPIAYPTIPPSPDPSTTDYVVVANNNGTGQSSATIIDVSGGTNMGNRRLGVGVNKMFFDASLITFMVPDSDSSAISVTSIGSSNGQQNSVQTRLLDAGSHPISMSPVDYSSFTSTYVVNTGQVSPCSGGSVRQFDLSGHVASSQNICVGSSGSSPVYAVLSPDQAQLFVLNNDGNVYVVNTKSEIVASTIPVGGNPVYARLSLDGKYLYVLNQGSANISVIDVAAAAVVGAAIPTGAGPTYMTIDRTLDRLYVANTAGDSVSMFDVTNSKTPVAVQATAIPVGSAPNSLAVLADGSKVYVGNSGSNLVSVINATSKDSNGNYRVVNTIAVGVPLQNGQLIKGGTIASSTRVNWIAASRNGSRVFAATTEDSALYNSTSIIDTKTDALAVNQSNGALIPPVVAPLQCDSSLGDTGCTCSSDEMGVCKRMSPVFVLNRSALYDSTIATSN